MSREITAIGSQLKPKRLSSLELMRIVLMLLIVAHHSVVNSGVMELWDPSTLHGKAVFLTLWGMWGKVCINAFVMITGYFMCKSRLTWMKFVKLIFSVYFWTAGLCAALMAAGFMGGGRGLPHPSLPVHQHRCQLRCIFPGRVPHDPVPERFALGAGS